MASAVRFVFPSGVTCKKVEGKVAQERLEQLLMANYSKHHCFLFTLKTEGINFRHASQSIPKHLTELELMDTIQRLQNVNAELDYFCVCLGVSDYFQLDGSLVVTQRVYCLVSLFPFVSFLEDCLVKIMKLAKEMRLERIRESSKQEVDCSQLLQMAMTAAKGLVPLPSLQKLPGQFHFPESLHLYGELDSLLVRFTAETFTEAVTAMFLQRRLIVQCNSSRMLTHMILLLTRLLIQPFRYPYPVIYVASQEVEQLLEAPMPIVAGFLYDVEMPPGFTKLVFDKSGGPVRLITNEKHEGWPRMLKHLTPIFDALHNRPKEERAINPEGIPRRILNAVDQILREGVVVRMPGRTKLLEWRKQFMKKSQKQRDQLEEGNWIVEKAAKQVTKKAEDKIVKQFVGTQMFSYYVQRELFPLLGGDL